MSAWTAPLIAQTGKAPELALLYPVGYQNWIGIDSSRHYKPHVQKTDPFFYRPVEIDLWYPARQGSAGGPMCYGDFLKLLQDRSNRFQDDTIYHSITGDLVNYIAAHLLLGDTSRLTRLQTRSLRHALQSEGSFPLVVYMSSFNGMSYENIQLFEFLAARGYLVACITSVGRYPGNMSEQLADLVEQIQDGSFAIAQLKKTARMNASKIGVIGYSWGGLAACGLATQASEIKCILSFDGSEMHYYGDSKKEDQDFDQIRISPFLDPERIRVPYTYLESGAKEQDREVDSLYDILPLIPSKAAYVRFADVTHEDFSCMPYLFLDKKNNGQNFYRLLCDYSLGYFDQYLKDTAAAFPPQLSVLFQQHLADSLYPAVIRDSQPDFYISGKIMDGENHQPLAYVNVGIPNENTGTVSQRDGSFKIKIKKRLAADSLTFSMVGYIAQCFAIRDIQKKSSPQQVEMKQHITELPDVVVSRKLLKEKTRGNTTTSAFVSVGLPLKFLGTEIGVRINLGKQPVLLKNFHFNISDTRLDSAVFRLNIYRFKNGRPEENMLQRSILIPVGHRTGQYVVPLSAYKLVMKDEILISIEWIEGSASPKENGAVFLSASFLSAATWHRFTSQAAWKKASGLGVGFNLVVQQLPTP